jgi:hypothetical protein
VIFEQMEQVLRERLQALSPAPRAELLHVLKLPDFDRADRIGAYWATQASAFERGRVLAATGAILSE